MKKNQKILLLVLILLSIGFILFLIYRPDKENKDIPKQKVYTSYPFTNISQFFARPQADQLVKHQSINIAYNEDTEQALWVCYLLTKEHLEHPVCKRSNRFKSDPKIYSKSASPKDYYKSGYDRGHLAPAADMLWSKQAMQESFYMSNMSPQKPGFNRGAWKKLESKVRNLAKIEDSIIVITGPLFLDTLGSIGDNEVMIPSHFYKIIVDISAPKLGAIAFVMPNRNTKLSLDKFAVTVDSLESLCHLDFMYSLPDNFEQQLEGHMDTDILYNINK